MTGRIACIAIAVAALVAAQPALARWADWPPGPTDAELAVEAPRDRASRRGDGYREDTHTMKLGFNLLLWTTHVTPEHWPILEKLEATGYDGVDLAAASDRRVFSYHYEPRENDAIVVAPSQDCVN